MMLIVYLNVALQRNAVSLTVNSPENLKQKKINN